MAKELKKADPLQGVIDAVYQIVISERPEMKPRQA